MIKARRSSRKVNHVHHCQVTRPAPIYRYTFLEHLTYANIIAPQRRGKRSRKDEQMEAKARAEVKSKAKKYARGKPLEKTKVTDPHSVLVFGG